MTAGQLGQLMVILSPIFFLAYKIGRPYFIRLRLRWIIRRWTRYTRKRDHGIALEIDKAWDRTYGRAARVERQRKLLKVADSIIEQDSEWQQRARKAEGLGFMDDVA